MTTNLKLSVIVWAFVLIPGITYANPVEVSRVENNPSIGDNAMKTKRESSLLGSEDKPFVINEDIAVDNLVQAVHRLQKRSPGFWSSLKSIGKNLISNVVGGKPLNFQTLVESAVPVIQKPAIHHQYRNYLSRRSRDVLAPSNHFGSK
ncbi:hypothetical protein PV325_003550 [Microctonus aethiopoides]|nr:hypothetical protein PV325_003550 [Microctonus aethiopoides]